MNENKYICIWYSWGDIESPVEVPEDEEPFDYMMEIALNEVRVSVVANESPVTIGIEDNEYGDEIVVLNYHKDNEFCYYKVFDNEEEANKFYDDWMNNEI